MTSNHLPLTAVGSISILKTKDLSCEEEAIELACIMSVSDYTHLPSCVCIIPVSGYFHVSKNSQICISRCFKCGNVSLLVKIDAKV